MHQLDRFNELCDAVKNAGIPAFERHLASSAATILFPKTHFDMVRVGIAQYGLLPSKETYLSYLTANGTGANHSLRPVLSWKTRVPAAILQPVLIQRSRTQPTGAEKRKLRQCQS